MNTRGKLYLPRPFEEIMKTDPFAEPAQPHHYCSEAFQRRRDPGTAVVIVIGRCIKLFVPGFDSSPSHLTPTPGRHVGLASSVALAFDVRHHHEHNVASLPGRAHSYLCIPLGNGTVNRYPLTLSMDEKGLCRVFIGDSVW